MSRTLYIVCNDGTRILMPHGYQVAIFPLHDKTLRLTPIQQHHLNKWKTEQGIEDG